MLRFALVTGPLREANSPEKVEVDRTEGVYTLLKGNVLWRSGTRCQSDAREARNPDRPAGSSVISSWGI